MKRHLTIVIIVALVLLTAIAFAQQPVLINYQGRLTDSAGDPVSDGLYEIEVVLFPDSTGGDPFFVDSFFDVQITMGYFGVAIDPALEDLSWPVFIEIRVEGEVMSPRQRITHAPFAATTQRVEGDILTAPGVLEILPPGPCEPPEDCPPAIGMYADSVHSIKLNWPDPQGVVNSAIELATVGNMGSRIWMYHPTDDPPGPMIEINADPINGNSITLHSAEPLLGGSGIFRGTPTTGAILSLNHNPRPHEQVSVIELSSAPEDFGHIKMFNGRIEPPPVYLEMNTAFGADQTGSNFIMYNPDPPNYGAPMVQISTSSNGRAFGASHVMFNPQPEPPGSDPDPFIELRTDASGGSMNFFNDIGQYMGVEPSPFNDGGSFMMYGTSAGRPQYLAIAMEADASGGDFKINWAEPLSAASTAIEIANVGNTGSKIWMYHPLADPPGPMIELNADPTGGSSIAIHSAEPLLGEGVKIAGTSTIGGIITLNTNPAPHEEVKVIELSSESPNGGSIKMFNPQVEPPPVLMEMNTSFNGRALGASLVMFNPQPEPPGNDPFIEMHTYDLGGSFNMYAPRAGSESQLLLEIKTDFDGAEIALGNSDLRSQLLSLTANNTTASIKLFDTGGGTTVEISNDGDIEAKRGNFGSGNTLTGLSSFVAGNLNNVSGQEAFAVGESNTVNGFRATILGGDNNTANGMRSTVCGGSSNSVYGASSVIPGGYGSTINTTALYSCLIGINASLSEDSTFMVDMPHIRFGDELNGYEFPTTDGYTDQVMITDGAGQLDWVDMATVSSQGNRQLLEIIDRLTDKVDQLENKIEELEQNINR